MGPLSLVELLYLVYGGTQKSTVLTEVERRGLGGGVDGMLFSDRRGLGGPPTASLKCDARRSLNPTLEVRSEIPPVPGVAVVAKLFRAGLFRGTTTQLEPSPEKFEE